MASNNANQVSSRIPPHNDEAEESVLGSILIDKDAIVKIADWVSVEDFYQRKHAQVYEAMMELYERGEPIDVLSVTTRLKEKKQLKGLGGESALAHLATVVPTSGNIIHYARIVQKNATRRRLISAAADISELGFNEEEDIEIVMDEAEQKLFSVSQDHKHQHFTVLSEALEEAFTRIDKLHKEGEGTRGVPTGFRGVDSRLAGWQKADLVILAARPSVGKTTLALDFARNAALEGFKVGMFSLEMSKDQLVDRMLAAHAHVDLWKLRTGKLDTNQGGGYDDDFQRIGDAIGELSQAPVFIDDNASANIMGMRTMARRLQADHGLDLLVIDYLQLMESSRYVDNRVQEVSAISRGLKKLAIELNVPILALSQLSRAVEHRHDQRPKLSDLRESGCLTAETRITRADTGERITIKDLADRDRQEPIPVFALDEHYNVVEQRMTKVFYSGKKQVYKLRTRSGRTIRASGNHPFRKIDDWYALEQLQVGDAIALPRHMRTNQPPTPLSEDELKLLAHLIGDGCTVPRQPIHYTSEDEENLETVEGAASRLFNIQPRRVRQENWWHTYLPSPHPTGRNKRNPLVQWLIDLGIGLRRSWEKRIPEAVFQCDEQHIALFLHHLWATDGNISWKYLKKRKPSAAIYYGTTSEELAHDVQHLLTRLGIHASLRVPPRKGSHRQGYQVHIQGAEAQIAFLEHIGCAGKRGRIISELVHALKQINASTNTDIIPQGVWHGAVTSEKERMGMTWRQVQSEINTAYCGSTIYKADISRQRMSRIATAMRSSELADIASSDVFWDEIIAIEPDGVEDVYDATVPGAHNFVANDIIVHNSIEQDADVVMFLHRHQTDEEEDGRRPEVVEVDLLIEKHRNGPTGEVPMNFHTRQVTYTEMEQFHSEPAPEPEQASA